MGLAPGLQSQALPHTQPLHTLALPGAACPDAQPLRTQQQVVGFFVLAGLSLQSDTSWTPQPSPSLGNASATDETIRQSLSMVHINPKKAPGHVVCTSLRRHQPATKPRSTTQRALDMA